MIVLENMYRSRFTSASIATSGAGAVGTVATGGASDAIFATRKGRSEKSGLQNRAVKVKKSLVEEEKR